jgi:hypothetical protein
VAADQEFLKVFNKWIKTQDYKPIRRYGYGNNSGHKSNCHFLSATTEPVMTTIQKGYCDTCAYESAGIEFYGNCSCGKNVAFEMDGIYELGKMIREMIALG